MFQNDDIDLVAAKVNPDNPKRVWANSQWADLQERQENLYVKGQAPVTLTLRRSPHGPIINDALASKLAIKPHATAGRLRGEALPSRPSTVGNFGNDVTGLCSQRVRTDAIQPTLSRPTALRPPPRDGHPAISTPANVGAEPATHRAIASRPHRGRAVPLA